MYVDNGQGTGPEGKEEEEEATQVDDVAGITIGDQRVAKWGDKWSFGRGGVFIGYGTLTCNVVRPPLQFMNKLDQGLIQRNTKDGSDSILGHSGIPSCEHWMFLGDAKPRDDEEVDVPDGGSEMAPTTTTEGGPRDLCNGRRIPRIDLSRPRGGDLPLVQGLSNPGGVEGGHRKTSLPTVLTSEAFWLTRCTTPHGKVSPCKVRSLLAMSDEGRWPSWTKVEAEKKSADKKEYEEELVTAHQKTADKRRRVKDEVPQEQAWGKQQSGW